MHTIPPPSMVSTVLANRLGVITSKSYNWNKEIYQKKRKNTQTNKPEINELFGDLYDKILSVLELKLIFKNSWYLKNDLKIRENIRLIFWFLYTIS